MTKLRIKYKVNDNTLIEEFENVFPSAASNLKLSAHFIIEQLLLDLGYRTHKCGCCLDPRYCNFEILEVKDV